MIHFLTLLLDGMPWLPLQYQFLQRVREPWTWWVVEGSAAGISDTRHCRTQTPRLSTDGSTEYMREVARMDHRVRHLQQWMWPGKTAMCNAAVRQMKESGWVWQLDVDEFWTPEQVTTALDLMQDRDEAHFFCRYFVGPDRYIYNPGGWGNRQDIEWKRLWRYQPPQEFLNHEPPMMSCRTRRILSHQETERAGLVFNHYAYVLRKQVEFKEAYYNKPGLVEGWLRLQEAPLPCDLHDFWPTIASGTTVNEYPIPDSR